MTVLRGTVSDGKIVLQAPPDWPDGLEVEVRPADEDTLGCTEDEQGDDPESIARWIAWMDSIQPLRMTPEEEAAWDADRKAQKEFELSQWDVDNERLRKLFE